LRPEFWTRFQSFFLNLTIFYLNDSVVVARGTWAGSYVGSWIENSIDFSENWVDETEQGIGVKNVALVAQDQTDSMRNLDGSSIPGSMFWSMDCSWVWHMLHSVFQGTFELGKQNTPQTGGREHGSRYNPIDHWCWVDLVY